MFRSDPRSQPHRTGMAVEDAYSVGIDETGDQELSSRQIQSFEIPTMADHF